jgi:hypothetical protein
MKLMHYAIMNGLILLGRKLTLIGDSQEN